MKYALVGYGRMGREIEAEASGRGHRLVAVLDPGMPHPLAVDAVRRGGPRGAEVAFEFTAPAEAERNVVSLLGAGVAVVCGTTGWNAGGTPVRRAARRSSAGAVIAPNFSVGMNLFYRVVSEAARLYGRAGAYDPFVVERHHRGKKDALSGTALRLAQVVAAAGRREIRAGGPEGPVPPGAVHVVGVRAGHEPGLHDVGFDGEHDTVTLTHRARGRSGFAHGAVLAAEWVRGRRGLHSFDDVLDHLLTKGGKR